MVNFLSNKSNAGSSWRSLCSGVLALALTAVMGVAYAGKPPSTIVPYTYYSVGNPAAPVNVSRPASPSYVLMGGGPDVDEAFRWMIQQAGIKTGTGGRLVVVRASGDGAYDPYIYYSNKKSSISRGDILDGWVGGASYGLTSVETLVIPSIAAANDPYVNSVVSKANAVWIAGGDQSNYIKFWKGQALETTLNALMANNVPIGGTSAGLAVLGQFDYSALNASVTSPQALSNPYNADMTLDPVKTDGSLATMNGFIAPHALANTILDSHFDSRDRMGRLVTFVSRLVGNYAGSGTQQFGCTGGVLGNNAARGIGLGVETALLVKWDPSGYPSAHYTGQRVTNISTTTESAVYFVNVTQGPTLCASGKPLTVPTSAVEVRKLSDTTIINLSEWTRTFPTAYKYLGVTSGVLSDTNPY